MTSPLDLLTQEYLDALNELTPKSSALGGYAMGLATALAVRAGYEPDRQLLEAARSAGPLPGELWTAAAEEQVEYVFLRWAKGKKRKRAQRSKP